MIVATTSGIVGKSLLFLLEYNGHVLVRKVPHISAPQTASVLKRKLRSPRSCDLRRAVLAFRYDAFRWGLLLLLSLGGWSLSIPVFVSIYVLHQQNFLYNVCFGAGNQKISTLASFALIFQGL